MRNVESGREERRLDDERCVDRLLAEAGLPDDAELRTLLLEMRHLRVTEVPEPSAELAALLGHPNATEVIPLENRPRKQPRKNRVVFTTLAVAASLGVAGGAAAANDGLRNQAEGTIGSIVGSIFQPAPKPAPASPAPTSPGPAPDPEPAAPEPGPAVVLPSPASVPSAPGTVPVPRAEPSGANRREDSQGPSRGHHARDDVEPGRPAEMQTEERPAEPAASRRADVPRYGRDRAAFDRRAQERPARGAETHDRRVHERTAREAESTIGGRRNVRRAERRRPTTGSHSASGATSAAPARTPVTTEPLT
jgi:hypothetical protein